MINNITETKILEKNKFENSYNNKIDVLNVKSKYWDDEFIYNTIDAEFQRWFREKMIGEKINIFLINSNIRLLSYLKYNLYEFKDTSFFKDNYKLFSDFNNEFFDTIKYYNKLNLYGFFMAEKKKISDAYYPLSNKLIIIVDSRRRKTRIVLILKDKTILSITPGIIYKRLDLIEKSLKKSDKLYNVMLKSIIRSISKFEFSKNILIHLKGTKNNIFNTLAFIKKLPSNNIFFIYSPHIINDGTKFKKIKSIKRKLRKKILKIDKFYRNKNK